MIANVIGKIHKAHLQINKSMLETSKSKESSFH